MNVLNGPETSTVKSSPPRPTLSAKQRLESSARALAVIDDWRRTTNTPSAGLTIERQIINRELLDLEEPDLTPTAAPSPRAVRPVVIPVRRISRR